MAVVTVPLLLWNLPSRTDTDTRICLLPKRARREPVADITCKAIVETQRRYRPSIPTIHSLVAILLPLVFYYRQCYDSVINLEETHDDRTTDLMSRKREQMFFDTGMDRSGTRAKCKSMLGVWPSSQDA